MKKFVSILLVMVLMITSLSVGMVGFAESGAVPNAIEGVSVSARTTQDRYNWGDDIYFDVDVTNNGSETLENLVVSSTPRRATWFWTTDGSGSATIDSLAPGETKTVQLMYTAEKLPFYVQMLILPFLSIFDSIWGLAFQVGAFGTATKVKVGLFSYRFAIDVNTGGEETEQFDSLMIPMALDENVNGVADCIENNDLTTDTDGDGLCDYQELVFCETNPLLFDTDGDGLNDAESDSDNDTLKNNYELYIGSNPIVNDTDRDKLTDGEEVNNYGTDPLKADTDGDGVSDGKEVELGTNPLIVETSFVVTEKATNEDRVKASVQITLSGKQVESLNIEAITNSALFPIEMPGYLGAAYSFRVDGTFNNATISFEFDEKLKQDKNFDPVIYYFNEKEQALEPLKTSIKGNVASTVVNHFSTYILINRKIYESSFEWIDVWSADESYSGVELVFVIDDSSSMTSNDPSNQRLTVARSLIDKLPESSKIGIVKFGQRTTVYTSNLTNDKNVAKSYLTTAYFTSYESYTYMYSGIDSSLNLFDSTDDETLRMVVVLSDGAAHDTSKHSSTISKANSFGIKIYTIGLGNSTSYFTKYLKPLADSTNGQFYLASNATQLSSIYEDIGDRIDLSVDSDGDRLPDYYEDNLYLFNGTKCRTDKNTPDTDGDGLLDGEEIKIEFWGEKSTGTEKIENNSFDGFEKIMAIGKMISHPRFIDSDGDGFVDYVDPTPLEATAFKDLESYIKYYYSGKPNITILVNQPEEGTRKAIVFPQEDVGHTFLRVDDGDGTINYVGFYPNGGVNALANIYSRGIASVDGVVYNDSEHKYNICYSTAISKKQYDSVVQYINSNINHKYNLQSFNCTTFAINAFSQADSSITGIVSKHLWNIPWWAGGLTLTIFYPFGYDPGDAGEDIRACASSYTVFERVVLARNSGLANAIVVKHN